MCGHIFFNKAVTIEYTTSLISNFGTLKGILITIQSVVKNIKK